VSNHARRFVAPLIALMAWGIVRADEPPPLHEICIDCVTLDGEDRHKVVSHFFKLKPEELSSLAFQFEGLGDKRVRVTVKRQGQAPSGFDSVEVVSKIAGDVQARTAITNRSGKPLEVASERVTVYYDTSNSWRILATAQWREDGRFLAFVPPSKEGKEFPAKRFSATFAKHPTEFSVELSGVTR
jgi:hypothetical protein